MTKMIIRILQYLRWLQREHFERGTINDIYDDLAKNNRYDKLIDYANYVSGLRKALLITSRKFKSILDIACGTGAMISALPNKSTHTILGIDFSEEMLRIARERFKRHRNVKFRKIDFMSASFTPSSFNLITIASAIRFIPEGKEVIFANNIARWLKKDGQLIVTEMTYPFMDFSNKILKLLGFPKGQNKNMKDLKKFIKLMNKKLILKKNTTVHTQNLFHKMVALYFLKR